MRILLIDDDESHRFLIRRAVSALPQIREVIECEGGDSARRVLLHEAFKPGEVVLLDLNLGGESGLSFLDELRSRYSFAAVPVVILSTSALERDFLASYQHQANAFIVKSGDPAQFRRDVIAAMTFFLRG